VNQFPQKLSPMVNISADSAVFALPGGRWAMVAEATWGGGNIALQIKCPNGAYAAVSGMSLTANGQVSAQLPPGDYKIVRTTANNIYANMVWVPE